MNMAPNAYRHVSQIAFITTPRSVDRAYVDIQTAESLLRRHYDRVTDVLPIVGKGSVNTIFEARVDGRRVVIRMNGRKYDREYAKEVWCLARAGEAGIPSPEVLASGVVDDAAYMILEYIEGVGGKQYEGDKLGLWHALGRYSRIIHEIPVTGFGNLLADPERGFFDDSHSPTWDRFVDYNLESLTDGDALLALGVYDRADRPRIAEVFESLRPLGSETALNHGDLALRNTIVGIDGRVTLFDWGMAGVRPSPYSEFATMRTWYNPGPDALDAFFDGYGVAPAEIDALAPAIRHCRLLESFDTLRWAIDHSADVPTYVDRARDALRAVIAE